MDEQQTKPRWKINQFKYINEYNKTHYHRVTVQISKDGDDALLWEAVKDAKSKNEAIKALAIKGLKAK